MKRQDFIFILLLIALFLPFFVIDSVFEFYKMLNANYAILVGCVQFAILPTLGEVIALRIRRGIYYESNFGLLPTAIVWGFLGGWIVMAMKVFAAGSPVLVDNILGTDGLIAASMKGAFSFDKLLGAFSISLLMNTSFAPIFMLLHKVTDTHIAMNRGKTSCLLKVIPFSIILSELNWKVQWNFVFKKTIPFFWLPAHTITFILPGEFQVLFAALLGIVLGIIMAIAANK